MKISIRQSFELGQKIRNQINVDFLYINDKRRHTGSTKLCSFHSICV